MDRPTKNSSFMDLFFSQTLHQKFNQTGAEKEKAAIRKNIRDLNLIKKAA